MGKGWILGDFYGGLIDFLTFILGNHGFYGWFAESIGISSIFVW